MRILLVLIVLFFTLSSCITDEGGCVNITDCPPGYTCEEGTCVPGESWDGVSQNDTNSTPDNSTGSDTATVNDDNITDQMAENDDDLPVQDEDVVTTDTETNDEVPDEADCDPGWHLEDEGDDENGNGKRDCTQNVTCISEPCNGNGACADTEWSVTCSCYDGYAGRWCEECAEGYLLSTVDSKCKADCATKDYGCTGNKECRVDGATNEAGCDCKDGFTGTDCNQCDPAVHCNSHGTCYAGSGSPVCTCEEAWSGNATCSSCGDGYLQNGVNCVEGCKNYCGHSMGLVSDGLVLADSNGTCQIISGKAECVCESGWKTILTYTLGGQIKPPCSDCDTDNPPTGGCPE